MLLKSQSLSHLAECTVVHSAAVVLHMVITITEEEEDGPGPTTVYAVSMME